ncbi:MAG TPA: hypothetical protein PKK26_10590 [Candidatus Wallbacteria bacterium]|nr:hypothetical protein [Candidatus Wallbacteria bacterium]
MVIQLKICSQDCLILIVGLSLILNVFMILFYLKMKKTMGAFNNSHYLLDEFQDLSKNCSKLNEEFEKVAMIRISELEDKISKLDSLTRVADEKIMQLLEIQKGLESTLGHLNRDIKNGTPALNETDIITRVRLNIKPDLSNVESRMLQRMRDEINRVYEELRSKIENIKISAEPVPKPVMTEASFMKPLEMPMEQKTKYITPPDGLDQKYAEIYKMAFEDGLDASEISKIKQMDKRTVHLIINLLDKKRKAQ